MRHNWNNGNTLPSGSSDSPRTSTRRQMTVDYQRSGTSFKLLTHEGLDVAGPLPDEVKRIWQPANPKRVGATRTQWPENCAK